MNGVLPSQGTTGRLRDSRSGLRKEQERSLDSVRRRLTFARDGLTEAEVNKRCGWPVGARVYLRILEERGEAHETPDRVWHLGPGPDVPRDGACNQRATRRPAVVSGPRDWLPHLDESATVTSSPAVAPRPKPRQVVAPPPAAPAPPPPPPRKARRARPVDERQQVLVFRPLPSMRITPRGPGRPRKGEQTMGDQLLALLPAAGDGITAEELVRATGLNSRQVTQSLTRAKKARLVECSGPKKCTRWRKRRKETR